jgi:peptide/nickel transport system substrate-binding protein
MRGKHFTKNKGLLLVILLGVLHLIIANPALAEKYGGTLVVLVLPEPPTLASYLSTAGPVAQVACKIYEGLLEFDFNHNPLPGLAKSWKISDNAKIYIFKLQEGVRFHDGKPFTSADVKFSIEEVLKKVHPRGANNFQELIAVETPDPLTVILKLQYPAPYLLKTLSAYESPMIPRHLFEGIDPRNNPIANKPIGTGPFKFVEWKRGQYIRVVKNKNYWQKGLPYLDSIIFRFIPDASTRSAAMENGEVHYAGYGAIPNVDVVRLNKLPHISVTTQGYSMHNPVMVLEINTKKPPLDKREVRQAIAYAIDRQFIIDNIWFGFGKIATSCISSKFKGLHNTEGVMQYNVPNRIAKANKLLDDAGLPWKDGSFRFEIIHDVLPYGEDWQRIGEYLKQALGEIGIKVTLRHEDVPTFLKRIFTDYDFDICSDFYYQMADPVIGMHRNYQTKFIRKGTVFVNCSRYSNPIIDELMEKATREADTKKRAELYRKIQQIISRDVPVIPVFEMENTIVYNKTFTDLVISPQGPYHSLNKARVAD